MKSYPAQVLILSLIFTFSIFPAAGAQEKDYEELKKEYGALLVDRDNILAQTRNLLEYKEKYLGLQKAIDELGAQNEQLELELEEKVSQIQILQEKVEGLEKTQVPLIQERDELKNSLEKFKIEYKILPETRKRIAQIKKENTRLVKDFKRLEAKIKRLEEDKLDAKAQIEIYQEQLSDSKREYGEALKTNRALEKEIAQMPKKFTELARENKLLIKQTALMHYNLGVFYTEKQQYSRAIAELEKAVELNPDDPYAYYNLGYIYAEYVVNRPRAIEQFRQFLRLTKSDDKDVDWVKKYILTWQTWEGKKPLE